MVERYGTRRGYYTSTTPIRHSRVIKRPRDLFPSESSLAARGGSIHYLRIYNYDTGESAACPKGNRPPPPPAPFNNRRSEGDRSSGSWNRTFSANPTPDPTTRSIPSPPSSEIGIAQQRIETERVPETNGFFTRGAESKGASSPRLHRRPSGVSTWV